MIAFTWKIHWGFADSKTFLITLLRLFHYLMRVISIAFKDFSCLLLFLLQIYALRFNTLLLKQRQLTFFLGVSFIYYVCRMFRKTNISYPLIHTRMWAYQMVRTVSFSENFAYILNEWSLNKMHLKA